MATGWLDRLQKSAHASEMDDGNTHPVMFVCLVAVQVVVTQAVAHAVPVHTGWGGPHTNNFVWAATVGTLSHWFGFLISLLLGHCKYFDIMEDISLFLMFTHSYVNIYHPSDRQWLVHALAIVWCFRLLSFVGYRILKRGHDFRFDKLSRGKAYSLFAWTAGGTWCFVNCMCVWVLADVPGIIDDMRPLWSSWLDWAGAATFAVGLTLETVADIQKYRFNAGHAAGKNAQYITSGLWSWSRHPNYVGEITVWTGIALICLAGGGSGEGWETGPLYLQPSRVALILCTPLWSCFFLVFTSLMLLEKTADAKWGRNQAYLAYIHTTPVLFPKSLPPLRAFLE